MIAIAKQRGRELADDFLLFRGPKLPSLEGKIALAGQGGTAVDEPQALLVGQGFEIAADGGVGNLHHFGQFAHCNLLVLKQLRHYQLATIGGGLAHARSLGTS